MQLAQTASRPPTWRPSGTSAGLDQARSDIVPAHQRLSASLNAGSRGTARTISGPVAGSVPLSPNMLELRRQQARFHQVVGALDKKNRWMAYATLAAPAAIMALEAGAILTGRAAIAGGEGLARAVPKPLPRALPEQPVPARRGGHSESARTGNRAHLDLKERIDAKPGWRYEERYKVPKTRAIFYDPENFK